MPRSLLLSVVSLLMVAACSVGAPATSSPAPSGAPTAAPSAAPTAAPSAAPTTAPTAAPGASSSPYCDPDMGYGCNESPGAGTPAPGGTTVSLSPDGAYLVGSNGMTLYVFDNDSPGVSACTSSGCAGAWPALVVTTDPTAGDSVTGTLTTFDRGGGQMQVQYNDRPLYFYSGDVAAGDTTGDGVNGTWHLATP